MLMPGMQPMPKLGMQPITTLNNVANANANLNDKANANVHNVADTNVLPSPLSPWLPATPTNHCLDMISLSMYVLPLLSFAGLTMCTHGAAWP
jgi:hypothetical protein